MRKLLFARGCYKAEYGVLSLRYSSFAYSLLFLPARLERVRPSIRFSVTRRYCVKTKKARVMISSPSVVAQRF